MPLTVIKARRILGKQAKALTDDKVEDLLVQFYDLAEVIANTIYKSGSNEVTKGIDALNMEAHNESRV